MVMTKLTMGPGWQRDAVAECFRFIKIRPGKRLHHFGLEIEPHITVHSISTIVATFMLNHLGRTHSICVVGDNQSFGEIADMREQGMLSEGEAKRDACLLGPAEEEVDAPFLGQVWQQLETEEGCRLTCVHADDARRLASESPQLGYRLWRYCQNTQHINQCDRLL
jgi:hypothetical protein